MPDSRSLGRSLGLFGTDPMIGAGLPYWLPAGAVVRHELEEYVHEIERRAGYRHVHSPVLGKRELYERSGHWAHYRDDMFPPMRLGAEEVVLRPSLCPHHVLIYRSQQHSHRELPVRIAELGGMFREEASGVLGGLDRVRAIQLNDAHLFCRPDQVGAEVHAVLDLIDHVHADLGIVASRFRLSLAGDGAKYVADPELWRRSEAALLAVLEERGRPFEAARDEAAFYGPKIDVQVRDSAGRESTLSTVQVDLHMPARFDLEYVGTDGAAHRPVMVHRSLLGSLERMVAQLLEVHGPALPAWLAPVQLVVLPVGDEQDAPARAIADRAIEAGLRAESVAADRGTLAARIRAAAAVPVVAVVGAREAMEGSMSLRLRSGKRADGLPEAAALAEVLRIAARPVPPSGQSSRSLKPSWEAVKPRRS
ncbi:threonine--tRNA ligase [Amnibacterium sp. CER49]|uniref:threonine--tRNA ligase n=1 Tax=Amnibacterium sp. CER49 TaxID=3039161 RepID=UPI00244B1907|nr:threonine--tRNA ligase [Amnibacterium sp. CER49]MDH2443539.1 threonine--tRNA ligase [Amnibacterium sp. CER49]